MSKRDILVLVEGEKTDYKLMESLFETYEIEERHQLVPYGTNIHALYNSAFKGKDIENIDIILHLREHEKDPIKKSLFDQRYSDIVLVFDLDPQDSSYSANAILEMSEYFIDSTDMGKLYINYPMIEAFYHVKSIPDLDYNSYICTLEDLKGHKYKKRVDQESVIKDRKSIFTQKSSCNTIIRQNIEKARRVAGNPHSEVSGVHLPKQTDILNKQLEKLDKEQAVFVLCTCAFYIVDYNSKMIE